MNLAVARDDGIGKPSKLNHWLIGIAVFWLFGPSSSGQWSHEYSRIEWSFGFGWGQWLSWTREGAGPYGDAVWQQSSIGFVAGWPIVAPLLLLATGLILTWSPRARQALGDGERFLAKFVLTPRALGHCLAQAALVALLAALFLSILLPRQQLTEVTVLQSPDVEKVRQAVEPRLMEVPGIREVTVERANGDQARILIESRGWSFRLETSPLARLPDMDRTRFSNLNYEFRANRIAVPLAVALGCLALFVLIRREMRGY